MYFSSLHTSIRLVGFATLSMVASALLTAGSHLHAQCASCAGDTVTLSGSIKIIGVGAAKVTGGGQILGEIYGSTPFDPAVWTGTNYAISVPLKDVELSIDPSGFVELNMEITPQSDGNGGYEPLNANFTAGTCSSTGGQQMSSGSWHPDCTWDPIQEVNQCNDPYWHSAHPSMFSRTVKIRVRENEDPAFDPGAASKPVPIPPVAPVPFDEVPPVLDSAGQTYSLGRHAGVPVGRASLVSEVDGSVTRASVSLQVADGQSAYVSPVIEVGAVKQFKSEEVLITITDLPGSPSPGVKVEIFSAVGAVQQPDTTYTPAGPALAVHEISRVSTTVGSTTVQGIKFQATKDGQTTVAEYYADQAPSAPGGFQKQYDAGRSIEVTTSPSYSGMDLVGYTAQTVEKDTGTNGVTFVKSEKVETFEKFPWGMELVALVEDPSGAAQTTTYVYYDSVASTAPHYGKLHVRYSSDGTWERHVYDANGRLAALHRPWLTSPTDATGVITLAADQCQVTEITERMTDGSGNVEVTTVEKIAGRIVSSRVSSEYSALSPQGLQARESRSETYLSNGILAQVSRSGREATSSAEGFTAGKALYSIGADGSQTLYEHSVGAPGVGETLPRITTISTQGTEEHPDGIARLHSRSVTISNSEGLIESRTEVALGGEGNYALLSKQTVERDITPQIQERTYQDGVLVSTTTRLSASITETVDEAGLVSRTIVSATTGEMEATMQKGLSTMGNHHDGSDLRTDTYKVGLSEYTLTHNGTTRPATPNASTADSSRSYDKLGRLVASAEKLGSNARTYTYTQDGNGLRSEKEWHASVTNPVRVSAYYPNGQLKSVTGEAEIGTYYSYGVEFATGLQFTTIYQGSANSPRWSRTYTDALGRVVREERPAPGGQGIITVTHFYNAKGQRTKSVNSARPNVPALYEYSEVGQLFRQGTDLNGNGKLDVLSNEPISERLSSYEQSGGYWWQVSRSRTYFEDGGSKARENEFRTRLGTGPTAYSQSIQRPGITTTTSVALTPSTRTRVTTTTRSDATNTAVVTEINGMQTTTTDFSGMGTMRYDYDSLRQLKQITYPTSNATITITRDALGRVLTEVDGTTSSPSTGVKINNSYDYYPASYGLSEGLLYSKRQLPVPGASGLASAYSYFAYDARGQQTHTWGPGTYPTKQVHDAYGQRTELHTYRAAAAGAFSGNPAYSAPPMGFTMSTPDVTTWTFDAATGLQTSKKDAANEEVLYSYNSDGSLHQRTWARGVATTHTYDDLGRLAGVTYSDSTPPVTHTYHRDGTRRTTVDAAGLLTQSLDPATGSVSEEAVLTAGSGQNLLSGAILERSYDAMGRIVGLQTRNTGSLGPVGSLAPGTGISYAAATGKVGSIASGTKTASYAYVLNIDGQHRTEISRTSETAMINSFDPVMGRRTRVFDMGGSTERSLTVSTYGHLSIAGKNPDTGFNIPMWAYYFNSRGEVISALRRQDNAAPAPYRSSSFDRMLVGWGSNYTYDEIGNRTVAGYGYVSPQGGTVTYASNALNQYTELSNSRRLFVLGSAQNSANVQVNGVTAVRRTTSSPYGPSPVNYDLPFRQSGLFSARLTASGTDAAWVPVTVEANTTSPAVSYTQTGNRYHPPATETMTYDEDGNITGDGRWVYTWDAENRLIGMNTQTSAVTAGVPNLKLTFAYDAQHRRIRKKTEIYDVPTASWVTLTDTRFVYDGWNLLVEVEMHVGASDAPAGASGPYVRRSYMWGTDMSGTWQGAGGVSGLLLVRRHARGIKPMAELWTRWDLTGNIIAAGSASYEYDPFGRLLRESEPEEDLNPFRFSTKYTDAETGLAYYGYRFYDAVRGRWINRDPLEEAGGLNLFAFTLNNPVRLVDTDGRQIFPDPTIPYPTSPQPPPPSPTSPSPYLPRLAQAIQDASTEAGTVTSYKTRIENELRNNERFQTVPNTLCSKFYREVIKGLTGVERVLLAVGGSDPNSYNLVDETGNASEGALSTSAYTHPNNPFRNGKWGQKTIYIVSVPTAINTLVHEMAHLTRMVPSDADFQTLPMTNVHTTGYTYTHLFDRDGTSRRTLRYFMLFREQMLLQTGEDPHTLPIIEGCCKLKTLLQ